MSGTLHEVCQGFKVRESLLYQVHFTLFTELIKLVRQESKQTVYNGLQYNEGN